MDDSPINADVSKMSISDLAEIRAINLDEMIACKAAVNEIDAELVRRFGDQIAAAYATANKSFGTVRVPLSAGFVLECDKDKSVSYDQQKMTSIASKMPWEKSAHLFKFKIEMGEAIFNAMPPDELKSAIVDARTVKTGAPKLKLFKPEPKKGS